METLKLSVAKDFSRTPGPRYDWEGAYSGYRFRTSVLIPALVNAIQNRVKLLVDLDGTAGFGTSFLEEAFGGLLRKDKLNPETPVFKLNDIENYLEIKSEEEPFWKEEIHEYLEDATK